MTQDHDSTKADDGRSAMQRYAAWHTRNCRCISAETAHDADATRPVRQPVLPSEL
jgi:hypothetical protein